MTRATVLTGNPVRIESPTDRVGSARSLRVLPWDEPVVSSESTSSNPVHQPVLRNEVVAWLAPKEGAVLVDGTVGAGGHAAALAAQVGSSGCVIGLDRDPEMLALAEQTTRGLPVRLIHAPYSALGAVLGHPG